MKPDQAEEIIARIKREKKARDKDDSNAKPNRNGKTHAAVVLADFAAYMPAHAYIFTPTGAMWPASSVNARIAPVASAGNKPIAASTWLDINRPVEAMTWAPGEPQLITNRLISDGGWIQRPGCTTFN